jgi:hypothetical protein
MQKFDNFIGVLEKRHFFAEISRKSQEIVIITLTPGHYVTDSETCGSIVSISELSSHDMSKIANLSYHVTL